MDVSLLDRTEDQKVKQSTAVGRRPPRFTVGNACEWMITHSLLRAMDWLTATPLNMERLTSSQAADGRALLRVMLWCSVAAAAAAVLALWHPAGLSRRRIRLALAHAALAFTVATHGIRVWLIFFSVAGGTAQESSGGPLVFLLAVALITFLAVADIYLLVAILRGEGVEEEEE